MMTYGNIFAKLIKTNSNHGLQWRIVVKVALWQLVLISLFYAEPLSCYALKQLGLSFSASFSLSLSFSSRIAFIFLSFFIFPAILQSLLLSPRLLPYSLPPSLFLFESYCSNCNLFAILNFAPRPSSRMQPCSTTVITLERGQTRIVYDPVNFPAELLEKEI